ncbi:hypothetical protein [Peribacillus frigoritolerans]|uniref:hypothetical protein n=1 Tax=Peribacillus frigoritolerans TaxID=450367 RepID=UPI003D9A19DC
MLLSQEGKALAKLRDDLREGRPRNHSKQQVEHALKWLETHTYKEVEAMTVITKRCSFAESMSNKLNL